MLSHGSDLLVNYQTLKSYRSFDRQDHGMAFINEEDQSRSQSGHRGHTGRNSGRGGGRGCGGNGGRGRGDRIPSTTPGAEPPRDAKDSGSARSHQTHLETSSSNRH